MRGRGKGSQFERDLCRLLSLWWTAGEREDVFWRTSQSGGRSTTRAKKGKKTFGQCGDIQATDPIGRPLLEVVTIEAKKGYNKETAFNALDKPKRFGKTVQCGWEQFVEQAEREAREAGTDNWLVIHKRDSREAIVYMPERFFRFHQTALDRAVPSLWLRAEGGRSFFAMTLTQFTALISPERVRAQVAESNVVRIFKRVSPVQVRKRGAATSS